MKVILLLSILVVCSSKNYECLNSTLVKNTQICSYTLNDVTYVRPCSIGDSCSQKDGNIKYCQTNNIKKYEGVSCSINEECLSDNCVEGKCVAKVYEAYCTNSYQCARDSHCLIKCYPYPKLNETCSSVCELGFHCVKESTLTSKCMEMYTLSVGQSTLDDSLCFSNTARDGVCYDTRPKSREEFKSCESDNDCIMELINADGAVVGEKVGECKKTYLEEKYCYPSSTSEEWKNYVRVFNNAKNNRLVDKVHQSLIQNNPDEYSLSIKEALFAMEQHNVPSCVLDNKVVSIGSGYIKFSFALVALLLTVFA